MQQAQNQEVRIWKVQTREVQSTFLAAMRVQPPFRDVARDRRLKTAGRDFAGVNKLPATSYGHVDNLRELWKATKAIGVQKITALGHLEARYGFIGQNSTTA